MVAVWEFQSLHQGSLPDDLSHAAELEHIANGLLARASVNKQFISAVPKDIVAYAFLPFPSHSGGPLILYAVRCQRRRSTSLHPCVLWLVGCSRRIFLKHWVHVRRLSPISSHLTGIQAQQPSYGWGCIDHCDWHVVRLSFFVCWVWPRNCASSLPPGCTIQSPSWCAKICVHAHTNSTTS